MNGRKPRILFCGEASFLSTGYGVMAHELLKRFHATGKYELFEFASYGPWGDPRQHGVPWNYMTAMPNPASQEEVGAYNASPLNAFGAWKFEGACLWGRPDIVVDTRDVWMHQHELDSPFRPLFHWAIQPTVDAMPQDVGWVENFSKADSVLTYTDWAADLLRKQGGNRLNLVGVAPPGVDTEVFKPVPDRRSHKRACGIPEDSLVLGMAARNQQRKLYPHLFMAFAEFLRSAPADLADRTFLYCHTAWPDVGWNLPRFIKQEGLGGKCLFTYRCHACNNAYTSFFADSRSVCRRCGAPAATFPTTHNGVPREVLAQVLNLFDVYVQYANSEGLGIPAVEAAACGVPIMAVDYSGMTDVIEKVGGTPIAVKSFTTEPETGCLRAIPDEGDFVTKLTHLLSLPDQARLRLGYLGREGVKRHFDWDRTAETWMGVFDAAGEGGWDSSPCFHTPNTNIPQGLSDHQFVSWGMTHVAGRPDLVGGYTALKMARDLSWGCIHNGTRHEPFGREHAMRAFLGMCERRNYWERVRATSK